MSGFAHHSRTGGVLRTRFGVPAAGAESCVLRLPHPLATSGHEVANIPDRPGGFTPCAGPVGEYRGTCDAIATHGCRGLRSE